MSNHHPAKYRTDPLTGRRVAIDVMLVPLIDALWEAGYRTISCCQDLGESLRRYPRQSAHWDGYVLLDMPIEDALTLVDEIKDSPQFHDRMHWAAPGAWEVSVPVQPDGWIDIDDAVVSPWAQIHFPNDQIDDLIKVIEGE